MLGKLSEFARLSARRNLSQDEIEAIRLRKLLAVLRHAERHVPFYRDLWQRAGVRSEQLRTLDDLRRWPIVTKQQLKEAGERSLSGARRLPDDVTLGTSGSTGEKFTVHLSPSEHRTRLLVEFRTLLTLGFRPRDRLAVLGPANGRSMRLHERLGLYRTEVVPVVLSVEEQILALRRFDPTILWVFPDALRNLLSQHKGRLSDVVRPRLLITSAAIMPEGLRVRLREELGCEIYNSYAAMETGRLAAECSVHHGLHVNADQVIVETEPEGWPQDEDLGAVLVTTLSAFRMPMIRYRLGDLSRSLKGDCPCGSAHPRVEAPVGRDDDLMVLPSGGTLGAWRLCGVPAGFPELDQFRLIQLAPDRLQLQIVVTEAWNAERQGALRQRLLERVGEPVHLEIRVVESIASDGAKFAAFVSRVPVPDEAAYLSSGQGTDRGRGAVFSPTADQR